MKHRCEVHGCTQQLFTPLIKYSRQQRVCRRHYYARLSGRVGVNWERDIHNFHRKGACQCCGQTAYNFGKQVLLSQGIQPRIRDAIRVGMGVLEGDHIKRPKEFTAREQKQGIPHRAENIQTLCRNCHRIKTLVNKDLSPKSK